MILSKDFAKAILEARSAYKDSDGSVNAIMRKIVKAAKLGKGSLAVATLDAKVYEELIEGGYEVEQVDGGYIITWGNDAVIEVSDFDELLAAIEEGRTQIKVDGDVDVDTPIVVDRAITIELVGQMNSGNEALFKVEEDGVLTLTGDGQLNYENTGTKGAVVVNGGEIVFDGPSILADTTENGQGYAYGIYAANGGKVVVKSGIIQTYAGSAISVNATTGDAKIEVYGGDLHAENGYAIYLGGKATVDIYGGIVGGINYRMGDVRIHDGATIQASPFDELSRDPIGKYFQTSGCVWLGDTIAVMLGAYASTQAHSHDVNGSLTIEDGAEVELGGYGSQVGIYKVDTKEAAEFDVDVANIEDVRVWEHEEIAADAEKYGKAYSPSFESDVRFANGEVA